MGANSGIAWTHHTFNPWMGCHKVSPGCKNCYAEHLVTTRMKLPVWGANAERKVTSESYWKQPARWDRAAAKAGERHRVFVASLADVFEDRPELVAPRARLFALVEATPNLDWLLLTKRPENMVRLAPTMWSKRWPNNVWAGTTTEDQERTNERIPHLLRVPARVRFVSYEPALEWVDFGEYLGESGYESGGPQGWVSTGTGLNWVIVGGESGPKARPFNPTWAKDTISACAAAGVPAFVKQMGSDPLSLSGHRLRDRAGADPSEWPAELRVQEFPR